MEGDEVAPPIPIASRRLCKPGSQSGKRSTRRRRRSSPATPPSECHSLTLIVNKRMYRFSKENNAGVAIAKIKFLGLLVIQKKVLMFYCRTCYNGCPSESAGRSGARVISGSSAEMTCPFGIERNYPRKNDHYDNQIMLHLIDKFRRSDARPEQSQGGSTGCRTVFASKCYMYIR
jgi:hypothetical protein